MPLTPQQRAALPSWASYDANTDQIEIDPDRAYPYYLEQCGLKRDRYGAEVARRCAAQDLLALLRAGGHQETVALRVLKRPGWAQAELPGDAADGDRGRMGFQQHYDALQQSRALAQLKSSLR